MEIKTNVKEIVGLVYGSGDLISEVSLMKRAEIGSLLHREHQSRYRDKDQSEVYIDYRDNINGHEITIIGRIDGVLQGEDGIVIEEIKSTVKDLSSLNENSVPAHLAQAKMYAYFYLCNNNLQKISIKLSYIHVESKAIKAFDLCFSEKELREFYNHTITVYLKWLILIDKHESERNKSLQGLSFPYDSFRCGQKELISAVYKNIISKSILYAIAPTGVGKTIATLYPALKAINQKKQKVFYATAKNSGKKIALDTVSLLMDNGLICKTIEITAKNSICFQKIKDCDSDKCPFADNYYGKLFPALQDIFHNEDFFCKETVSAYAKKHQICPFEFSLDLSYYADIIICDYNYVFCPLTHLKRYFDSDAKYQPILLVDEAHNLASRSKAMYSGLISAQKTILFKEVINKASGEFAEDFTTIIDYLYNYEKDIVADDYTVATYDEYFVSLIGQLLDKINDFLDKNKKIDGRAEIYELLSDYIRFVTIADYFDENFVYALAKENNDFTVHIDCLNASAFLLKTIKEKTLSSIFFSATLYPLPYYMKTLTEDEGNSVRIDSPFDPKRLKLIFLDNVSIKYRHRERSIVSIIEAIRVLGNSRPGNYIVFFPSYSYMQMVYKELKNCNFDFSYLVQKPGFTFQQREEIITVFRNRNKTQIGLFVMGGMFSEGIDYIGDMLNGVIIVGVGLPYYGGYNNVVKAYFERKFSNGFDFAYTFPGFTKVVQAVGRVIRQEKDFGVAILIDTRFGSLKYQNLFPQEWSEIVRISDSFNLSIELDNFWSKY